MLIGSICVSFWALISERLFIYDYWTPQFIFGSKFGMEDFIYGFLAGGIANVVYEEIFGIKHSKRKNRSHDWSVFLLPVFGISLALFVISMLFFKINTMLSVLIPIIILTIFMIYLRKDLLRDAIISGIIFSLITFLNYIILIHLFPSIIDHWYHGKGINYHLFLGVPMGEIYWAIALGAVAGPFYEFFVGLKYKK